MTFTNTAKPIYKGHLWVKRKLTLLVRLTSKYKYVSLQMDKTKVT